MNRYGSLLDSSPHRKRHRGLKIFLGIVAVLVVAGGIAFALNYNTVMLFMGKGKVTVPNGTALENSLKTDSQYGDVQTSSDSSGNRIVTAKSADGAVTIHSTTGSSGEQNIEVQMDVKKMPGVTTSKSASNLTAIQNKINGYLAAVIDPSQLSGVESYVAREALAQYQSGQKTFSVSNTYGETQIQVTGDFSTGVVQVNVVKP